MNANDGLSDFMNREDIDTYLASMTEQQQLEFRCLVIGIALKRINRLRKAHIVLRWLEPLLVPRGLVPPTRPAIQAIRRWLETPTPETQALVSQLTESVASDQVLWVIMLAIGEDDIHQFPGHINRAIGWAKGGEQASRAGAMMYQEQVRAAKDILSEQTGKRNHP